MGSFPEPKLIHKELRCCVIKDLYFRLTRDFQRGMLRLCKKINIANLSAYLSHHEYYKPFHVRERSV